MSRRKQSKPQHVEFPDNKNSLLVSDGRANTTSSVTTPEKVVSENDSGTCEVEATQGVQEATDKTRDIGNELNSKETTDCNELTDESTSDNPVQMAVHRASLSGFDVSKEFSPESLSTGHGQFISSHRSVLYSKYNAALDGHNQTPWKGNQEASDNRGRNRMDTILLSAIDQSHVLLVEA